MHKILIYLHIIYLLKSSTCFEHYPAHLQEVYVEIVYMQPLVSSLSAGDCPVKGKCKAIPLQAWTGPEGSRDVEAPRFQDNRHMKVVRLSALPTGRLCPTRNIPGTQFC